jgi:kynurenine aminotransferase
LHSLGNPSLILTFSLRCTSQGDEVICIEPFFDQYTPSIIFNGGVPVYVPLHPPKNIPAGKKAEGKDWTIDFDELRCVFFVLLLQSIQGWAADICTSSLSEPPLLPRPRLSFSTPLSTPSSLPSFPAYLHLDHDLTPFVRFHSNPVGKMFTREELEGFASVAIDNNILVLADEVYDCLSFDGKKHERIATLPGMWERTITVGSAGSECY